jgi:hypothetical protein
MHQDRIHDRVDVVRRQVWQPDDHDVGLAVHLGQLLRVQVRHRDFVDGLGLSRVNAGDSVWCLYLLVELVL